MTEEIVFYTQVCGNSMSRETIVNFRNTWQREGTVARDEAKKVVMKVLNYRNRESHPSF